MLKLEVWYWKDYETEYGMSITKPTEDVAGGWSAKDAYYGDTHRNPLAKLLGAPPKVPRQFELSVKALEQARKTSKHKRDARERD